MRETRSKTAAHRRAAPRRGDLAATCSALGGSSGLADIKRYKADVGSPYRGPSMRGSRQRKLKAIPPPKPKPRPHKADGVSHLSIKRRSLGLAAAHHRQPAKDVHGIGQLVILLTQLGGLFGAGAILFDLLDLVLAQAVIVQTAPQIGLGATGTGLLLVLGLLTAWRLFDNDIRADPERLNGPARRRVIPRRGQSHRAITAQRHYRLYRALAETLGAHHDGPVMILQGACDDLRRAGGTAIDQHHDGLAARQIARRRVEALAILRITAPRAHDLALIEERIRHLDRLGQQTAGIVAQIQNDAA